MEQVQRVDSALSNDVSFCWAHFQDPHFPFSIESVADGMIRDNFDTEHVRTLNDEYISGDILDDTDSLSKLVEMYDENIRYLDRQLSKLLEKLDKQGWFENGVVAITADHGEVFGESGMTNHPWDALPLDALTQIPLLISTPSNEATIHDQLVQHSDLFRFLAGHLTDDIPSADHRYNLYDDTHRYVVSKSNAVVRCLSSDGSVVNFRDGRMDIDGSPSQSQIEYTKEISFPSIEKSSGTIPGVPDSNHQEIEKRLEALGYVD
ncbi:sulfatase [Haladaptatus paucihalophilus DX253]|nr:sulfatase [Haladaptatus paucihalophilus DX253]